MSRYIDAYALLEIFKALKWDASCSIVKDMPTADVVPMKFHERCMELEIKKRANMVERKHGRWIDYKCSICGFEPYDPSGLDTFNFCSNCGADMRGA